MGDGVEARWRRALWLVAEHGVLDTHQVGVLLGVSRPTAHRLLGQLVSAGLLERRRIRHLRDHRWLYQLSWSGGRMVTEARRRAGLAVFGSLFGRGAIAEQQHRVNELFVGLVGYAARSDGRAGLLSWRHRVDAEAWLAEHGVAEPECAGSGIWLEDGAVVRFAVLWLDRWEFDPAVVGRPAGAGTPVDVVLAVTGHRAGELAVLDYAFGHRLAAVVACTTVDVLAAAGPAGPAWATTLAEAHGIRRRLAKVASP